MKIKNFLLLLAGLILALLVELSFIFNFFNFSKELTPVLGVGAATLLNYLFFRFVGLENPFAKAVFVSLLGIILFWGACVGILLILAPGLSNM